LRRINPNIIEKAKADNYQRRSIAYGFLQKLDLQSCMKIMDECTMYGRYQCYNVILLFLSHFQYLEMY